MVIGSIQMSPNVTVSRHKELIFRVRRSKQCELQTIDDESGARHAADDMETTVSDDVDTSEARVYLVDERSGLLEVALCCY